jgi:hypothetical protein
MQPLVEAVRAEVTRRLAEDEPSAATPDKYDQAAA